MDLPEAALTGNDGSHVIRSEVTESEGFPSFFSVSRAFSYYRSSTKCRTVVQVPWLRDVTGSCVEIPPKTRYKQKQNETQYENITH